MTLPVRDEDFCSHAAIRDPLPQHDRTRAVTGAPLLPGALRGTVEARVRTAAEGLIETLVARGAIDAIADLATCLPLTIVAEPVGLPAAGQAGC